MQISSASIASDMDNIKGFELFSQPSFVRSEITLARHMIPLIRTNGILYQKLSVESGRRSRHAHPDPFVIGSFADCSDRFKFGSKAESEVRFK